MRCADALQIAQLTRERDKLKGPATWTCFHLYVILDIFSRCVVGWLIALREGQHLFSGMPVTPNIIQAMKHTVKASVLTISTDRA